jgi:nitrogen-specific signal transduction histidine kinase
MQPFYKSNKLQQHIQFIATAALLQIHIKWNQLIILLTPNLFALAEKEQKKISMLAELIEKRLETSTDIKNGIEAEIENKILLPFFSTRNGAARTNLPLSKNFIETHGGYLPFKSSAIYTRFTICLVL